jgi:DNA ligase (NAD+)
MPVTVSKKEFKTLIEDLRAASKEYYNSGKTNMDDATFDEKKKLLKSIEPDHPFLKEVGAPIADMREAVKHKIPMGSLGNAANIFEYETWHDKFLQEVIAMHKLDGSSVEIIYEDGVFIQAITRGDGFTGEDVTPNVRRFKNVPIALNKSWSGSIRGEAMLLIEDFNEHFSDSANPRNAANGTVRRTDNEPAKHMVFHAFDSIPSYIADANFTKHSDRLEFIKNLGFEAVEYKVCKNVEEVSEWYEGYINGGRDDLPYEIDGLVVRVNDDINFADAGLSHNNPKAAIALKFPPKGAVTKLMGVKLTLGHNGQVAPTADLSPVHIGGVEVTSAFLNNWEEIERLDVAINDDVRVIRAGDVIPKIVDCAQKAKNRIEIKVPSKCWECGSKIVKDGANHYCKNEECPGRIDASLKSWIKKRDIKFLGDSARQVLSTKGYTNPADLYELSEEFWKDINNGHNILAEINKSRECSVSDFFGSLGIRFLGRRKAKKLVEAGYDTFDKFRNVTYEEILQVETFGHSVANEIIKGILTRKEMIDRLIAAGVDIDEDAVEETVVGSLNGKSFCFTGKIEKTDSEGNRYKRDAMHTLVRDNGGIVSDKVHSDLNYLVQADPSSESTKTKKAKKMGIFVIDHDDFLSRVGI